MKTTSVLRNHRMLMGLGSITGTPHSDSTNAHTPTPGKRSQQLALPDLEDRSPIQEIHQPYEVEEPTEETMMEMDR